MAYPFIAAPDHWPRGGVPVRAIAIHHAEGGGTVSWLTRNDGNSSHYVVEYSGRIVQMVREDRAAGSINPNLVRLDDDPPFTFEGETVIYGVTANKAALGDHWRNPNAAVIAIEVEGFARDGPNSEQRASLRGLVADIRTRHPGIPALGHRDWQSYKACPGKRIPWPDYGGHGKAAEVDMVKFTPGVDVSGTVTVKHDTLVIPIEGGERPTVKAGISRPALGMFTLDDLADRPCYLLGVGAQLCFIAAEDVIFEATLSAPLPQKYSVIVGGKLAGEVELP